MVEVVSAVEQAVAVLVQIERKNRVNCTGLGEVGCDGRNEWHSWAEHRQHVAAEQAEALADAGLLAGP